VALLTELAHAGKNAYEARWRGRPVEAVVEKIERRPGQAPLVHFRTANYLPLIKPMSEAEAEPLHVGRQHRVVV
jgi:hypothetical protein